MEVEYCVESIDLIEFHKFVVSQPASQHERRSRAFRTVIWCSMIGFASLAIWKVAGIQGFELVTVLSFSLAVIWPITLSSWWQRFQFGQALRSRQDLSTSCCRHRTTIDSDGFTDIRDDAITTSLKWQRIERVALTNGLIMLFTAVNQAHLIPRRAFADEAGFQAFFQAAEQLRQAASRNVRAQA
jgi:YcxB-like protein